MKALNLVGLPAWTNYVLLGAALYVAFRGVGGAAQDLTSGAGSALGGALRGTGEGVGSVIEGAVDGSANVIIGIGGSIGMPKTSQTQCQRDLAAGKYWAASFSCPAKDFIKGIFN